MKNSYLKPVKYTVSIAAIALLASCGGGGSNVVACSPASSLLLGFQYSSPGISAGSASVVQYQLGVPFTNQPVIIGVPDSCKASQKFTVTPQPRFSGGPVGLPSTVNFDSATGAFSGTVNIPLGSCSSGGIGSLNTTNPPCNGSAVSFEKASFNVTLTLPGFSGITKSVSLTTGP